MNSRRAWVRLDNASNIFLAAMSDVDTKVFRLSADLDEVVDPTLLQQALDTVFDQYVLYHSVLRRGVFWYYLEESDLRPTVTEEVLPPCDHLYHFDRHNLLFRVVHHGNRIVLEVLHALSDGTGASWVLQDLVSEYVRLRHPDEFGDVPAPSGVKHGLDPDSFGVFHPRQPELFTQAARPAPLEVEDQVAAEQGPDTPPEVAEPRKHLVSSDLFRRGRRRVHRIRGQLTPDHRTRLVELTMDVTQVLPLARAHGVSLTIYLTALFLHAIREVDGAACDDRTMAVSVPVDLRQRFASESARNFFATTRLEHCQQDDNFTAMCASLAEQLAAQTTSSALEAKLRKLIGFEHHPFGRLLPRPIKDVVLGAVNRLNNRNLTVAMTNIGRVSFPGPVDAHVGAVYLAVSAARPQFSMASHGNILTVSFTSPFIGTEHQTAFVRELTGRGVAVQVATSKVTPAELNPGVSVG
ncbi:alcohol acetyltransferase [Tessaracoccus sp. SD287]|uniref:alcohol acetyltransferase n=1 Tax=Tessaracoccus sp. SD287 TaxID=2782008 RepID=UPI001A95705C|nr:alcohol acetyltransferase [Tessaracoccus sp. SD287]MBO1029958.1 alcohol acetyltransferase [Tessaracoccus sp. SD287]